MKTTLNTETSHSGDTNTSHRLSRRSPTLMVVFLAIGGVVLSSYDLHLPPFGRWGTTGFSQFESTIGMSNVSGLQQRLSAPSGADPLGPGERGITQRPPSYDPRTLKPDAVAAVNNLSPSPQIMLFVNSGTYVPPTTGVYRVQLIGGGGGGGGGASTTSVVDQVGGTGGAAGAERDILVLWHAGVPVTVIPGTAGGGGPGAAAGGKPGTNGGNGGTTTLAWTDPVYGPQTVTADGGQGGFGGPANSSTQVNGPAKNGLNPNGPPTDPGALGPGGGGAAADSPAAGTAGSNTLTGANGGGGGGSGSPTRGGAGGAINQSIQHGAPPAGGVPGGSASTTGGNGTSFSFFTAPGSGGGGGGGSASTGGAGGNGGVGNSGSAQIALVSTATPVIH